MFACLSLFRHLVPSSLHPLHTQTVVPTSLRTSRIASRAMHRLSTGLSRQQESPSVLKSWPHSIWDRAFISTSRKEESEEFREELRELMQEEKERERTNLKSKYEAWKLQQQEGQTNGTADGPEATHQPDTTDGDSDEETPWSERVTDPSLAPRDTHFSLKVQAQDEHQMKQLIGTMEEALRLQLMAAPYGSLPVSRAYEELGILCHQCMDFTKAIKYYRHALTIHEKLASAKIKESDEAIDLSSDPVAVTGQAIGATSLPTSNSIDAVLRGERVAIEQLTTPSSPTLPTEDGFRYSFATGIEGASTDSPIVNESIGSFDTARCLSYLGVCYRDAGKLEKAKELLLASLRMKYLTVGQYHESTAETLNNLGALYHAVGNFLEAADCYEDAIRILIGVLGGGSTTSPYLAMAYYNLGVTLRAGGQLPHAIVALSKAHRISGAGQGVKHAMTVRIEQELVDVKDAVKESQETTGTA